MLPRHAFSNTIKIDTVYNANNRTWQGIHDSITMAKNHELFETDFIVQNEHPHVDSTRVNIQVNKHCMTMTMTMTIFYSTIDIQIEIIIYNSLENQFINWSGDYY